MFDTEILARNYTDAEVQTLLLDVFARVPASRTPFFVRLLRRAGQSSIRRRATADSKKI